MMRHGAAKLIYLSHPRTASVATEHALYGVGFERVPGVQRHDHISSCDWWTGMDRDEQERWTLLTTVRNPYDAVVSWWLNRPYDHGAFGPAWLETLVETETDHLRDGRLWSLHGEVADRVLRFEALPRGLEVLGRWGLETPQLPVKNVTTERRGRHYREFYDRRMRRAVRRQFAGDIARYGYRWRAVAA